MTYTTTHTRPYAMLWLDLETTGLDPNLDGIIEVAWQMTDHLLEPLSEMVSQFVMPGAVAMARWEEDEFVSNMHHDSGLVAEWAHAVANLKVPGPQRVSIQILASIEEAVGDETVRIAGSGVSHFDLAVLRYHMPALHARLDWRPMDVGQIEEWAELVGIPPYEAPEGGPAKTHRAADDVRYHQAEARYYLDVLRGR